MTDTPPEIPLVVPAVRPSGISGHLPPQAIEAEQSVLGAMLLSKDAIDIVIEILNHACFYKSAHQKIYKAIVTLYTRDEEADLVTVSAELESRKQLADCGGRAFLAGLTEAIVGIANVEYHARLVLEAASRNALKTVGDKIIIDAFDVSKNTDNILDDAEQRLFNIKARTIKRPVIQIGDISQEAFSNIEKSRDGSLSGLPSGYRDLDKLTTGFQDSEFIIIACRPSIGKTSLGLNIAEHLSIDNNIPTLIFSLEMSAISIVQRILSSRARVSSYNMRSGYLKDAEWTNLSIALGPISAAPIFIDDSPTLTVLEMRAKARRQKSQNDIKLVIVDYLQLITGSKSADNREQQISFISRSLKAMARELEIPVIALSQLSRQVEIRGKNARPQLSDLRESGSLEQDSDVVIFIYRGRDNDGILDEKAEIIVSKQRNGPTGVIDMMFLKDYTRFVPLEKHHRDVNDNTAERY